MQYRVYDRQTLTYKDGGYVRSYTVDDDYIVNNNSTLSIVKKLPGIESAFNTVAVGDVIALIENSGAYHKGIITTVDYADMAITYKSDKELFNDNMSNILNQEFAENEDFVGRPFGIDVVAAVLKGLFVDTNDKYKNLPITFVTAGDVLDNKGNPKMLWKWDSDSIKIVDWLVELFTDYNLSLSWVIDFNTAEQVLENRRARYICTLSAITNSGGVIKDNVAMQTITYTTQDLPDATMCIVISSETKQVLNMSKGTNLLDPNAGKEDYYIIYHDSKQTPANVWVIYDSRSDSKLSGYIRMRNSYNTPEKGFTYSQKSGDMLERSIVAYDKDYKKIGYINYKPTTAGEYSFSFDLNDFHVFGAVGEEAIAERRKDIRWFSICYSSAAQEPQLERGNEVTEYDPYNVPSIYYLYDKDGEYSISTNNDLKDKMRVLPVKTIIASYNENNTDSDSTVTPEAVAREKLIPSRFNQAVQIRISADSKMFDFENVRFGDEYKIINAQGTIDSNYTGRKSTSENKWVTLYFGLGRQNYTDLMQMRLRKARYNEIYNAR